MRLWNGGFAGCVLHKRTLRVLATLCATSGLFGCTQAQFDLGASLKPGESLPPFFADIVTAVGGTVESCRKWTMYQLRPNEKILCVRLPTRSLAISEGAIEAVITDRWGLPPAASIPWESDIPWESKARTLAWSGKPGKEVFVVIFLMRTPNRLQITWSWVEL